MVAYVKQVKTKWKNYKVKKENKMSQIQKVEKRPLTIASMLVSPDFKKEIKNALPKHLTADRLARIALTEVRKNPKLTECTIESFASSVLTASQMGLELGGAFGQGYLVPYGKECQLILGYRGMVELAHRSGKIKNLHADAVYSNDFFDFEYGSDPFLKHKPNIHQARGEFTHAYACASLIGGGFQFVVLSKEEIDKIKNNSKSSYIWNNYYNEMGKKTAIRRIFKLLPVSAEIVNLLFKEDAYEREESIEESLIIGNNEFEEVRNISYMEKTSKSDKLSNDLELKVGAID